VVDHSEVGVNQLLQKEVHTNCCLAAREGWGEDLYSTRYQHEHDYNRLGSASIMASATFFPSSIQVPYDRWIFLWC
jgi:hypothetical protein